MADTPAANAASGAAKAFLAALPPNTGADIVQVAADLVVALKAEINAAINQNAPHIPIVGGLIKSTEMSIANATLDNAVASLNAYVQTGGT